MSFFIDSWDANDYLYIYVDNALISTIQKNNALPMNYMCGWNLQGTIYKD